MKKILFLPLAAALAFAGCSDDSTTEGPDNGQWTGKGTGYLAVTISTPANNPNISASSTRATDGGFEQGEFNEQYAPNGLFLLFKTDGTQYGDPQSLSLTWRKADNSNPAVDQISNAVIVIGNQDTDGDKKPDGVTKVEPNRVVCVLNAPNGLADKLKGQDITQIRKTIDDYSFTGEPTTTDLQRGSIVMTNSIYLNEAKNEEFAVNIAAHIASTPETAKLNPVNIYVERVVAKVRVNGFTVTDKTVIDTELPQLTRDGKIETGVVIRPELQAIALGNVADKSYLFKKITGLDFTDWSWNDIINKRCYWAVSPSTTEAEGTATAPLGFRNQSWNQIKDSYLTRTRYYIQENTSTTPTCVMLKAQLHEVKDGTVSADPITLCKLAGLYYTPAEALKQMATYAKNAGWRYMSTNDEGKTVFNTLEPEDLRWMTADDVKADEKLQELKGWLAVTRFNKTEQQLTDAGLSLVKIFGVDDTGTMKYENKTIADLNTAMLADQYHAWMWTNGCTYYFVDIEHFGIEKKTIDGVEKDVPLKGIVRNHAYELTLNSVMNLGVPVFDPDETIIPEKPSEDAFYVAAQIHVLKWKYVKQTVDFK